MAVAVPVEVRRWVGRRPEPDASVACCAPFVTMEFGAYGNVQACCANALYPIGDVRTQSLTQIWHGPRARALRAALRAGDLSTGCGVCRHRLLGEFGELPRDYYDQFGFTGGADPEWPRILTFSLHNTCNLACVMCGGDESSRIRTQRDGLPPLPQAYGDAFFEQLPPFLAHADFADFVGGEPFLVRAHRRVWDMLIEQDHHVRCSATTNGTVWNEQIERVLEALDFQITVSVDGLSPATFEAIRVGASHSEVFANIERFRAYTASRGTGFSLSWSMLRQNWNELGTMLRWAEARGIAVKVQTVLEPEFGAQAAPTDELVAIVDALREEDRELRDDLTINADVWHHEVERLSDELDRRATPSRSRALRGPLPDNHRHVAERVAVADASMAAGPDTGPALRSWAGDPDPVHLLVDREGALVELPDLTPVLPPAVAAATTARLVEPMDLATLLGELASPFGGGIWIVEEFDDAGCLEFLLLLGRLSRDKSGLVLRILATGAGDGRTAVSIATSWALLDEPVRPPTGSSEPRRVDGEPLRTTAVRLARRVVRRR